MADYEDIFDVHRGNYRKKEKLDLLDDLQGQFREDDVDEYLTEQTGEPRWVMVTADRWDDQFDYGDWDMLLSLLSRFVGRSRIRKPLHQMRVIYWCRSRNRLLDVLRVARKNPSLKFRRLLLMPYERPVIGHRLDPSAFI